MPRAPMPPVAPLREHAVELAHPFRQVSVRRRDHKMAVVAHQAVRRAAPVELPYRLPKYIEELRALPIVLVDRLTTIATRRHVIQNTTEFGADRSRHGPDITPRDTTMLDLPPASHSSVWPQLCSSV